MNSKLTLWGVKVSPYVRKVQVALNEKQLPYTHEEILPAIFLEATGQAIPETFASISPLGRIPVLQDDGVSIADSAVICAYLDKKYNTGQTLYPSDAEQFAKTLWFEHYGDEMLTSVIYRKIFVELVAKPMVLQQDADQDIVNKARDQELPPLLTYLNEQIGNQQWLAGDEYSAGDIAVATHFVSLQQCDIAVDASRFPQLDSYLKRVFARDAWQEVIEG